MQEISNNDSRLIMLDILKDVSNFCDKHGLVYFLAYGTLIGAVRHQGFIPWDDDIDIEMPRPDYERFISLYRSQGKYSICAPPDEDSFLVWSKVYHPGTYKVESGIDYKRFRMLGVDIDVFPMDGMPSDISSKSWQRDNKKRRVYAWLIDRCRSPYNTGSIRNRMIKFACRLLDTHSIILRYVSLSQKYAYDDAPFVGFVDYFPDSATRNRHRRELFYERIKVSFEGQEYWTMKGYHEYLTNLYGDYMSLPPVEKRITHHINSVFWKNEF